MNRPKRKITRTREKDIKEVSGASSPQISKVQGDDPKNDIIVPTFQFNLPHKLKEILAIDNVEVLHFKDSKIFNIDKNLDLHQHSFATLTIDEILNAYLDKNIMDLTKHATLLNDPALSTENIEEIISRFSIANIPSNVPIDFKTPISDEKETDKREIMALQLKIEYLRGIRLYFNKLFESKLLYKNERTAFNKFKASLVTTNEPQLDDLINTSLVSDATSTASNSSLNSYLAPMDYTKHLGMVPLLRFLQLFPDLIEKSGLTDQRQISEIQSTTQDFVEFLEHNL